MVPFLAIRKKGWALLGYAAGGALIVALTAIVPGGVASTLAYVEHELPRISRFGEWGTDEMRLSETVLAEWREGLDKDETIKDGVVYERESFRFTANGTLVRVLQRPLQAAKIGVSRSWLSALIATSLFGALAAWQLGWQKQLQLDAQEEIVYWQMAALIVLLSGPLTWVMNLVWLLPLVVIVLADLSRPDHRWPGWALGLAAVGLVVIALPDAMSATWMTPTRAGLIGYKYVAGELLLLVAMVGYLSTKRHGRLTSDA
jgi:hypothetical protein